MFAVEIKGKSEVGLRIKVAYSTGLLVLSIWWALFFGEEGRADVVNLFVTPS